MQFLEKNLKIKLLIEKPISNKYKKIKLKKINI